MRYALYNSMIIQCCFNRGVMNSLTMKVIICNYLILLIKMEK